MISTNQIPEKEILIPQFKDMIQQQIDRLTNPNDPNNKPGLYMVTTHLHEPEYLEKPETKLRYVINTVPSVYKHILNKTVKRHKLKGHRKYHPFMLSFVDYSGSRQHDHRFNIIPHVHSILVVHPKVNQQFKNLMENGFRLDEGL